MITFIISVLLNLATLVNPTGQPQTPAPGTGTPTSDTVTADGGSGTWNEGAN